MASRARTRTSDARLVAACLAGDEDAWVALVERYERLVFAIALDYGGDASDAADLFQAVWIEVHNDLPSLRKRESFKPWLVSLANRRGQRWSERRRRRSGIEVEGVDESVLEDTATEPAARAPEVLERRERDQLVREAVDRLPDRCREMIRLLFFTDPPRPYKEVARTLGLATGSIGFIRGRCLDKLRRAMAELGLS